MKSPISRPFMKYFGSKWRMSKHYPSPRHSTIIEPFAGSACYSLQYPDRNVILCDLDPDVAGLWKWLITASESEILSLPTDLVQGQSLLDLPIAPEAQKLIARWQRVGCGTCMTVSKWNGTNSGLWCESTRNSIAANLRHIRHWEVLNCSYLDLENTEATWFIDPVYQHVKGYKYNHMDYPVLAEWCSSRLGQVIVCEQDGADWLPFTVLAANRSGRTSQGGTRKLKLESVWLNDNYPNIKTT